jgi:hypothetical protein
MPVNLAVKAPSGGKRRFMKWTATSLWLSSFIKSLCAHFAVTSFLMLLVTNARTAHIHATKSATKKFWRNVYRSRVPMRWVELLYGEFFVNLSGRMVTRKKLIIVYPIALRLSPIWVPIGVVTVGTCYRWVERMHVAAQSAKFPVTPLVHTWFQISVGCPWKLPTNFSGIGKK